jgi:hypothetical protein
VARKLRNKTGLQKSRVARKLRGESRTKAQTEMKMGESHYFGKTKSIERISFKF